MTMANGNDKEYLRQGRLFLNQAQEELSRDDLRQASEKGWGATVQLLKAYAEERGLEHDRPGKYLRIISRLVDEADDDDIQRHFGAAFGLRDNTCRDDPEFREVSFSLEQISLFVDKVESLLNGRNGA